MPRGGSGDGRVGAAPSHCELPMVGRSAGMRVVPMGWLELRELGWMVRNEMSLDDC